MAQHLAERGCRVDVAFCPERIAEGHALEELHSLPQIIGADTDVAAERAAALFGTLAAKTIRTTTKEAELAKLFTNTWRYMKFAVANQFFMIADQAGVDYSNVLRAIRDGLSACGGPAGPRASRPVPACSRTRCSSPRSPPTTSRSARRRCRSTRACRPTSSPRWSVATAASPARPWASSGWPSRPSRTTPGRSLSYKLRKLLSWAGARVVCTDPYVADDRLVSLDCVLDESDILILGAPHKAYRGLKIGGKDLVDVWGAMGQGIRL